MNNHEHGLSVVQVTGELEKSIESFNPQMALFLEKLGLPTEEIFSSVEDRRKVINSLESAIAGLPIEDRQKSYYLTKFTVAISVGLFDGALNYLWDETIRALRRFVAKFDLDYFFSVAEKVSSKNSKLSAEEHLAEISDHDLLETCRRIGLVHDVNFRRLENVNFMRNHASAAHPNEVEIDGFEMLGFLSVCLKYAITAQPDASVINIKRLLENVRTVLIPPADFTIIGQDIQRMSQERIDDLLWTLFGMYVDSKQTLDTKTNIEGIATFVWEAATEDRRYEMGSKYGVYRKNAEITKKDATDKFLSIVSGLGYKDEDSLSGELLDKLGELKSAHFGQNNFYNESPHAQLLKVSIPTNGVIPRAAKPLFVKVISLGYLGNGFGNRGGVDQQAFPIYKSFVEQFSTSEVFHFLKLFSDSEFNSELGKPLVDKRTRELSKNLQSKTNNVYLLRALKMIVVFPADLQKISSTTDFQSSLNSYTE